jgi:chromosome partitioning protein
MNDQEQLLGLAEAANLLRVTRQTIGNWRQRRDDFPQPLAELKSGPVWERSSILEWAESNGIAVVGTNDTGQGNGGSNKGSTTVALTNMKGGVGKSTLAANLGWFCAQRKKQRVLLVDLDPQFNLSQYVLGTTGYEKHLEAGKGTVLDVFERATPASVSGKKKKELLPEDVIATVRKWPAGHHLDLLPSRLELSWTLKNPTGKEPLLDNLLDYVRDSYDLVLLDCPPTDSILTKAAYMASDSVLIPVKPEFLSTIGLPLVVRSLEDFAEVYNHLPEVLGIVFNAATDGAEQGRSRSYVKKTATEYGWYVFRHELSYSQSYPAGSRQGTPIFNTDYARWWKVADFIAVADEFVARAES